MDNQAGIPYGTAKITASDKLRCAARELALRRAVYPKWVKSGRMKQTDADREIAVMDAIVADYATLNLAGGQQQNADQHENGGAVPAPTRD